MSQKNVRRQPLYWLMPLAFALPFLGGMIYVAWAYGGKIVDLLTVAVKLAVIS